MNEKIKLIIQNPKVLITVGICGILLIFISSIFSGSDTNESKNVKSIDKYDAEQYCKSLEDDIKNIGSV